ncbi:class I chitinase [Paenibacillus alvei TS-15]|uniref:Class I chitinase n=1 Tax=Paenibacillus alvei TS-15 TaxID=1117108 RepID=S9U1P5_PAEAL|nr:LysM peptidoglycan-binding domain-containing protein [Paenibacillus alvei]EPY08446.1 class I chitinase [Paenibacillus alvei TS-15]
MIEYVVRPGDSLFTIASRYGVPVSSLIQANHLTNTDIVNVGQVLCIPMGGGRAFPFPPPPTLPLPPPIPPFPGGSNLEQRVTILEQQVRRLQWEVAQLQGSREVTNS